MAQKYTYTDNGIVFDIEDNAKMAFSKITNMDGSVKNGDIVPVINAVEIDWNNANLAATSTPSSMPSYINTTSDLLSAIKYASMAGSSGVQGNKGIQGSTGIQGRTGAQGAQGKAGAAGTPGGEGIMLEEERDENKDKNKKENSNG